MPAAACRHLARFATGRAWLRTLHAAAAPIAALLLLALSASTASASAQEGIGVRPWPENWFSDLPAVDMTGTWVFDPAGSDPMLADWQGREVIYEINHQAAFIILEFRVQGAQSNTQRYNWDGTIQRFERGGRVVEEAARWTDAGRTLQIAGRHWDPTEPEDRVEYGFRYRMRGDVLDFVQDNDTGNTVWRFQRREGRNAGR